MSRGKKIIPEYLFAEVHPTKNGNKKLKDYSGGCNENFGGYTQKNLNVVVNMFMKPLLLKE